MTVGLNAGITLSRHRKVLCNLQLLRNRKWAGPITHRSRKRRKLSWVICFRFPYVQIMYHQALKLSGWSLQQPRYVLEKFEGASSKQSGDNDDFLRYGLIRSYLPKAIIWIFSRFDCIIPNMLHIKRKQIAFCTLFWIQNWSQSDVGAPRGV